MSFAAFLPHASLFPAATGANIVVPQQVTSSRPMTQLRPHQRARIVAMHQLGDLGERLMEMGLVDGTEITLLRQSRLGGILQVGVRGYILSLRASDASGIEVVVLSD